MHKLHELKEKLMSELEDYSENGKFSKDDVEAIKYITSAVDHLCNIMDDGEYSNSYEGGNMGYSRRYTRNGGSYARRRDSMGRYSRTGYSRANDIKMQLEEIMDDAPNEQVRSELQRIMSMV